MGAPENNTHTAVPLTPAARCWSYGTAASATDYISRTARLNMSASEALTIKAYFSARASAGKQSVVRWNLRGVRFPLFPYM